MQVVGNVFLHPLLSLACLRLWLVLAAPAIVIIQVGQVVVQGVFQLKFVVIEFVVFCIGLLVLWSLCIW